MDRIDKQAQEFKMLGIKELFRGPLVLTLLSLSIVYIVYQHTQMIAMIEENREREVNMQDRLYNKVIDHITPDLQAINSNIDRTNQIIDSVTINKQYHEVE